MKTNSLTNRKKHSPIKQYNNKRLELLLKLRIEARTNKATHVFRIIINKYGINTYKVNDKNFRTYIEPEDYQNFVDMIDRETTKLNINRSEFCIRSNLLYVNGDYRKTITIYRPPKLPENNPGTKVKLIVHIRTKRAYRVILRSLIEYGIYNYSTLNFNICTQIRLTDYMYWVGVIGVHAEKANINDYEFSIYSSSVI